MLMNTHENQIKRLFFRFNIKFDNNSLYNAVNRLNKYIYEANTNPFYTNVYCYEKPLKTFLTKEENVNRICVKLNRYLNFYNKNGRYIDVIDNLSIKENKRPLYVFKDKILTEKRFIPKELTKIEYLEKQIKDQCGFLLETYIVAELNNNNFKCPVCNNYSTLSLCDDRDCVIDSFRDAICIECFKMDRMTIFEIKTRNSYVISKNIKDDQITVYAGDYISINILKKINIYSVYMLIYARDTGDVLMCKVQDYRIRANERYLYGLQENINIGSLSSEVTCNELTHIFNIKPSDNYITIEESDSIAKDALSRVLD